MLCREVLEGAGLGWWEPVTGTSALMSVIAIWVLIGCHMKTSGTFHSNYHRTKVLW